MHIVLFFFLKSISNNGDKGKPNIASWFPFTLEKRYFPLASYLYEPQDFKGISVLTYNFIKLKDSFLIFKKTVSV